MCVEGGAPVGSGRRRRRRRPVWKREAQPSGLARAATAVFRGKGGEEL